MRALNVFILNWVIFGRVGRERGLGMGWTVRGSNPGDGEIFRTGQDPASYTMGKAAGAWR
jgi:hypothetical protein